MMAMDLQDTLDGKRRKALSYRQAESSTKMDAI